MTLHNYLYDKGVSYFVRIRWLEYMTPLNYLYNNGVSYSLLIPRLENMTPPSIYSVRLCYIFYAFGG